MLSDPLFLLAAVACIAVVAILALGIGGFARGGDFNRRHANRLMRYRIAAQGLAVVLIVAFAWLRGTGGN